MTIALVPSKRSSLQSKVPLKATVQDYDNILDCLQCSLQGWAISSEQYVDLVSQVMEVFSDRGIIGESNLFNPEVELRKLMELRSSSPPKKQGRVMPFDAIPEADVAASSSNPSEEVEHLSHSLLQSRVYSSTVYTPG